MAFSGYPQLLIQTDALLQVKGITIQMQHFPRHLEICRLLGRMGPYPGDTLSAALALLLPVLAQSG
ncbi:hypothetical protein D3C75_1287040 [compost metagenome]